MWQHKKPIFVIPAEAGIQEKSGCRIKSGMAELLFLLAEVIIPAKMMYLELLVEQCMVEITPGLLRHLVPFKARHQQ
ncbi:hypothetical protein DSCW_04500 [Desulfosarcina widdelii]|uniref:Uncharacterized protein n=1 Tax=Desulfosarcina widdelii TaxID=947919 RepID=A0A5K7YYN9_9BACT|nr:hypothetical protein DSCW_04500 [Desulfosarcina widdelii]